MRFVTLLFTLAVLPSILLAQRTFPEFGKSDMTELELKSCSFEPEANAMILFDITDLEYEKLAFAERINTVRRVRIKIFNEKGYSAGTIRIPYYSRKKNNKIKDLKGVVYTLDASGNPITQLMGEDDFFIESTRDALSTVRFTFPNLKPGSVLEYTYSLSEKDRLQFDPWIIQGEIPVAYSSTVIVIPETALVKSVVFGDDSISIKKETFKKAGVKERIIYEKKNVASFAVEPYMSSLTDNLLRVVFALEPSRGFGINWFMIGSLLLRLPQFGGQVDNRIQSTNFIIDSAFKIKSKTERARYIFYQVRNRFKEKPEQTIIPGNLTNAWDNKIGNSAEINLLLLNLLRQSDILTSHAVLVSTRENGMVNTAFPSPGQLNGVHVLFKDSDKFYLLDASNKYQSFDIPPLSILNRQCYLLDVSKMNWLTVTDDRFLIKENRTVFAGFNKDDELEGALNTQFFDYSKVLRLDSTTKLEGEKTEINKIPGLKLHSVVLEEGKAENEPLNERIEFTFETNSSGDFYFIKPNFLTSNQKNPFIQAKRNSIVDLICNQQHIYSLNLAIPENWEVESLPKNTVVRTPDSSLYFFRTVNPSRSTIYYTYTFEINRAIFEKEEYTGIKEFFSTVYGLMNEEIILKKKK